jgi:hypothetical protein
MLYCGKKMVDNLKTSDYCVGSIVSRVIPAANDSGERTIQFLIKALEKKEFRVDEDVEICMYWENNIPGSVLIGFSVENNFYSRAMPEFVHRFGNQFDPN